MNLSPFWYIDCLLNKTKYWNNSNLTWLWTCLGLPHRTKSGEKKGLGDIWWYLENRNRAQSWVDIRWDCGFPAGGWWGSNPVEGPFWGQLPYFRNFHNEERQIAVSACRYKYIWEELDPNLVWRADSGHWWNWINSYFANALCDHHHHNSDFLKQGVHADHQYCHALIYYITAKGRIKNMGKQLRHFLVIVAPPPLLNFFYFQFWKYIKKDLKQ